MKEQIIELLVCPRCLPEERGLSPHVDEGQGGDIQAGFLSCPACRARYPVTEGVATLLPQTGFTIREGPSKYETDSTLSSYLWSHYADLWEDPDAHQAYSQWSAAFEGRSGFFLDAGCAVGRLTFEMAGRFDLALGIDNSYAFIRTSRELMRAGQKTFSIQAEGLITEVMEITLPEKWKRDSVEFVVADAQALPFRSDLFSGAASLNLADKLPSPKTHLEEMNRVCRKAGAEFLFSDPFSWSADITPPEQWLGGTVQGPHAGKGMDNIQAILRGERDGCAPPWRIAEEGWVWWKIRNHRNHFELIRSCFVRALR